MNDGNAFSLSGKVVVLCGGSGLLGRALTSALSEAGATLVVTSRDPAKLEPVLSDLRARDRPSFAEQADPASEASILALRDRIYARHQRVDGLVYNAINRTMKTMNDDLPLWEESMATNATGAFSTLRAFGDAMALVKGGSIVNISSIQGLVGMSPWLYEGTEMGAAPDYFFHKAGLIGLTRYLASYYGPEGVRVNAVAPGGIWNPEKPQAAEFVARYNKMTAQGRMGNAAEMTGAVTFLLSAAASYITGITLPVDGGYTAR